MGVVLVRIDDRLVHGQVVEGWLKSIRADHIVVASDSVAEDDTQKALYMLAVPFGVRVSCLTLADCAQLWKSSSWQDERVLVLVASPQEALQLVERGATMRTLNVGGIHFRTGRVQVLKAVSLDDVDIAAMKTLASKGVVLEARPLPLDEPIDVRPLLDRWQQDAFSEQPR